jgi:hypothetical protein
VLFNNMAQSEKQKLIHQQMLEKLPEIQAFYDAGNTIIQCCDRFGYVAFRAVKRKLLKTRSVSSATRLVFSDSANCEKIKLGVIRAWQEHPESFCRGTVLSEAVGKGTKGKYGKNPSNIYELNDRTRRKILARLNLSCCICGWNEHLVDIHHIVPRSDGGLDSHSNLSPLCPNHHRLAGVGKLAVGQLKTLEEIVGDRWKEFYYG